jgi:hypothetical protein
MIEGVLQTILLTSKGQRCSHVYVRGEGIFDCKGQELKKESSLLSGK